MASNKANNSYTLEQACINSANRLIQLCQLPYSSVRSIHDINSHLIVLLFEKITGCTIPDLLEHDDSIAEMHNVQAVIDTLSLDLLGLSLSHITGENVVSGDMASISNLLEVLETVFLHLFPRKESGVEDSDEAILSEWNHKPSTSLTSFEKLNQAPAFSVDRVALPARPLKRKLCRRTLRKSSQKLKTTEVIDHPSASTSQTSEQHEASTPESKHNEEVFSERCSKIGEIAESAHEKDPKFRDRKCKHIINEGIEQLHELNFEKRIRAVLLSSESPILRAQKMKRNYLQNLRASTKKSFPACRKSFLLPHNLRRKPVEHRSPKKKKRKVASKPESANSDSSEKQKRRANGTDIPAFIRCLLQEFPGFQFTENTLNLLTKRYYQHLSLTHGQLRRTLQKKTPAVKQAESAVRKQSRLSNILTKDLRQKNYLRELKEQKVSESRIKCGLRDARLQSAKMKQYFEEFQSSMRKKMQKRNFTEELIVEQTFNEMLNAQKEKVRQLCKEVHEADKHDAQQHRQYLSALQNLYQQQLSVLSESLTAEQKESLEIEKARKQVVLTMDRDMRDKLQADVRSLQKDVLELMKDTHFRELDAYNFIQYFQEQEFQQ